MARTRAISELERLGVEYTAHRYDVPGPAEATYGEAVAAALGVEPARVFKTLVAEVDGDPVVGIVPVTGSLSLKGLARARGGKRAAMAESAVAERLTGYVTGGISPFGQRRRLPVVLDAAAGEWDTICVSGGRRGLQVEVAPGDLADDLAARIAPISG